MGWSWLRAHRPSVIGKATNESVEKGSKSLHFVKNQEFLSIENPVIPVLASFLLFSLSSPPTPIAPLWIAQAIIPNFILSSQDLLCCSCKKGSSLIERNHLAYRLIIIKFCGLSSLQAKTFSLLVEGKAFQVWQVCQPEFELEMPSTAPICQKKLKKSKWNKNCFSPIRTRGRSRGYGTKKSERRWKAIAACW